MARVDARADRVAVALAFHFSDDAHVACAVVCPDVASVREWVATWPSSMRAKVRSIGPVLRITVADVELIVADDLAAVGGTAEALFVTGAADPARARACLADPRLVWITGQVCDPGHPFHDAARAAEAEGRLYRVTHADVAESFPDQADALDTADPDYARVGRLENVAPRLRPLVALCSRRLWVETDRPAHMLSVKQRAAAGSARGHGDGMRVVPFDTTAIQKRYLAMKRLGRRKGFRRFLLLKYRRGGFTTLEQAQNYLQAASSPRSHVATVAHTLDSTKKIFQMARRFHEFDPGRIAKIGDSTTRLELDNGSTFQVGTAGGRSFSRGDTLSRVHMSEVAWWDLRDRMDNVVAGITEAARFAEVVGESTPNGSEWFCRTYKEARAGRNAWYPIFLPWFVDATNRLADGDFDGAEVRETLSDRERAVMQMAASEWRIELDLAQIAWRRARARELGVLLVQEYPEDDESCFLTSGICRFDVERLLSIRQKLSSPIVRRHVAGGVEVVWEYPEPGKVYSMGVDTSEGLVGCDAAGLGIVRNDTGAQVFALHGTIPPDELAKHCVRASRLYNDALIGVERNNHGHAVLQKIIDLGCSTPHQQGGSLYCAEDSNTKDAHGDRVSARPGWLTSPVTRPIMIQDLAEAIASGAMEIRDPLLVSEALTFRLQRSGKWEADPGCYDDAVMKWAIAWQMLAQRRPVPAIEFG